MICSSRYSLHRLLTLVWLALLSSHTLAAGKEIVVIGLPEFSERLNYIKDQSPAANFVRAAVSKSLTAASSDGALPYTLSLVDNLSVSADQKQWSFHLAKNKSFSNGAAIMSSDVMYSLRECQRAGKLSYVSMVKGREGEFEAEGAEQWVDVYLSEAPTDANRLALDLIDCPIVEKSSAELFGEHLGQGTNLVGSGDFEVTAFKPQTEISLRRVTYQSRTGGLEELKFRGFRDPNQALAAIRIGTVDLFLTKDEVVLSKARKDETLLVASCLGYSLVKRKGFLVNCEKSLDPLSFKYES